MPPVLTSAPEAGWQPSPEDFAPLAPRAQAWLRATARLYELSELDALRVCECLRVLSRAEQLLGSHRRVCHSLEVEAGPERLLAANLHASNDPDPQLVGVEIDRAASFLSGIEPVVLCGDFNVRRHGVPGFSEPIDGVDQVLVRGFELERGPESWPEARRRTSGVVLSDHAPVEAVIASTS